MKKIVFIFTILLAIWCGNVKAATCGAKLIDNRGSVAVTVDLGDGGLATGYINMARIANKADSSQKGTAFCLAVGKNAHNGATYVLDRSYGSGKIKITNRIRQAYAYANNITNFDNENSQLKYLIAQTVIWQELEGQYNETALKNTVIEAFQKYYCIRNNIDSSNCESAKSKTSIAISYGIMFSNFKTTLPYTGNLYVYQHKTDPDHNQPFLTNILIDTDACPTTPGGPGSTTPSCPLGAMRVDAEPAVCSNNDNVNNGHFEEVYDSTLCGDGTATRNGTYNRSVGAFCKLYCTEEVYQSYPGGIGSPIALGTNIVWPTSTATEHTVWKNLYSLSYTGKKTCKLVIAGEETIMAKFQQFASLVSSYQKNRGYSNGECDSFVNSAQTNFDSAKKSLDNANLAHSNAWVNYNVATTNLDSAKSALASAESAASSARNSYQNCMNSCQNSGKTSTFCKNNSCNQALQNWNSKKQNVSSKNSDVQAAENTKNEKAIILDKAKSEQEKAQANYDDAEKALTTETKACDTYKDAYENTRNIIKNLNTCLNYNIAPDDLYKFKSDTSIVYNDPDYGTTYSLVGSTNYSCEGCSPTESRLTLDTLVNDRVAVENAYNYVKNIIVNRKIVVTANATYTLPTDNSIYKYIDKRTNSPMKNPTSDYINVGYSFLPTSYNASVKKPYDLKVIVDCLGENCKFIENGIIKTNDAANDESYNYTCHYSLYNGLGIDCVCPVGTEHAGEDLYPIISNASINGGAPMSCATAQLLYCGDGIIIDEQYYCPSDKTINITSCVRTKSLRECVNELCPGGEGDKFCTTPNGQSIKITACLNNGNSYQYCVNNLCNIVPPPGDPGNPPGDDGYHCPKGTFNDGMDIKPCVFANINMGLDATLQYCKDTVCPYRGGINIIYRTISLRNPFPGKTAGVGVTNRTNSFNLDHLYGRYPGANWNSQLLVEKQILYNRGVEGYEVYSKEPLYTFILDPSTIAEWRKYNDSRESSGGYADNTLDCNSNGVACINSVIRDPKYGLVGGVCSSASKSNFYVCSES